LIGILKQCPASGAFVKNERTGRSLKKAVRECEKRLGVGIIADRTMHDDELLTTETKRNTEKGEG